MVGAVGIALRLEADAAMLAVTRAVEADRRPLEAAAIVELEVRLGRENVQGHSGSWPEQRSGMDQIVSRQGLPPQHKADVVGDVFRIAQRSSPVKVEWRTGGRTDFAGWNEVVVDRRIEIRLRHEFMVDGVRHSSVGKAGRQFEVEVAMAREVAERRG